MRKVSLATRLTLAVRVVTLFGGVVVGEYGLMSGQWWICGLGVALLILSLTALVDFRR